MLSFHPLKQKNPPNITLPPPEIQDPLIVIDPPPLDVTLRPPTTVNPPTVDLPPPEDDPPALEDPGNGNGNNKENGNGKGKGKGNRPPKGKSAKDELAKDQEKAARIAAKHNLKLNDLDRMLEYDDDLAVDLANERLMYLCESAALDGSPAEETPVFAENVDPPTSEAFLLHSRPGASRIIYLDFNGKLCLLITETMQED